MGEGGGMRIWGRGGGMWMRGVSWGGWVRWRGGRGEGGGGGWERGVVGGGDGEMGDNEVEVLVEWDGGEWLGM